MLILIALFSPLSLHSRCFAAAPLLPKRTVPQRVQPQAVPNPIVWANSGPDTPNNVITDGSLIQVAYDEEFPGRIVPPAPPLRRFLDSESFSPDVSPETDFGEEHSTEDSTDDSEHSSVGEQILENEPADDEIVDFPPLNTLEMTDLSQYQLPFPADSEPQPTPTTFASDFSSGSIESVPLAAVSQGSSIPMPGQNPPTVPAQPFNPQAFNPQTFNPQTFNPQAIQQMGYVNPYGYGPYGYPNAPGAYWGPTGFAPTPYTPHSYNTVSYPGYPPGYPGYSGHLGYPGYPSPYGYRPPAQPDVERSESLTSTTWETLGYFNPLKSPKGPNRGVGGPLMMRSWRDRPFYLGAFGGVMSGTELVSGLVEQGYGGTGGVLFGWYADNYWGLESRLHFAGLPGKNTPDAQAAYEEWYQSQNGTAFVPPTSSRNNAISMVDISVHYYPLGNAKWRPFLKLGLGTSNQQFRDLYGEKRNYNSFMIPWGIGLKYWWNERIALQVELTDNVLFAVEETKTQNNVALTFGLNFPLGKIKRKDPVLYWPMMPSSGR